MRNKLIRNERGAALIEAAVTIPIILLISVAIFEFGRAYQTWQVLTNAAREGARVAVLAGTTNADIRETVKRYGKAGGLVAANGESAIADNHIVIDRAVSLGASAGSQITVNYPFQFIVLNPVARLVVKNSKAGQPLTMSAAALMRNESGS